MNIPKAPSKSSNVMREQGSIDQAMNIVFATDSNYIQHLAACIASLLSTNRDAYFRLFILQTGDDPDGVEILEGTVRFFGNASINVIGVERSMIDRFVASGHITTTAFTRLCIAELLPQDIDRILYLDCDIVVRRSIRDLYNTDLGAFVLGAVEDLPLSHAEIGYAGCDRYFNSGVMIVNLKLWRECQTTSALIAVATTQAKFIRWHDQDILNLHFKKKFVSLDLKWNFQPLMAERPKWLNLTGYEFLKLRKNACIIHFTTHEKPWKFMDEVHFRSLYYKYLRLTPYRTFVPADKTLANQVRKLKTGIVLRRKLKWLLAPVIQLTKHQPPYRIPVRSKVCQD